MKLRFTFIAAAFALSTQANAQQWVADSVEMGASYANDIFYSLKNGEVKDVPADNWHLGFQMTPPGPYGNVSVIANQVKGGVSVYSLHLKASTNFTTLTAADTIGKTQAIHALNNADTSWNFGAFNRMNNPADQFDYSWGKYDMTSHDVKGDSLYLITVNNQAYKVWIMRFDSTPKDSIHWEFRIAKFDGTEDTLIKIYREDGFTDRLFAYYNVANKTIVDREPGRKAWDLLFTRYKEYMPGAPTPFYSVMGLLSNFDVTVAQKTPIDTNDTTGYASYAYSAKLNEVGSDWKQYDRNAGVYVYTDSLYYFIKTNNTNEYYQLYFTHFGGEADGKVVFMKRFLGAMPTGIRNINTPVTAYYLVPNPANNNASVLIDIKEQVKNAQVIVSDITGKVVYNTSVSVNNGLNTFNLSTSNLVAGTYVVTITNGSWKASEKLIVQH